MQNREINLLEEYGLHIDKVSRGRGGSIYTCKEGTFLQKVCHAGEKRMETLWKILSDWEKDGLVLDNYVGNKDGKILVMDGYQNIFLLRKWFAGRECDILNPEELVQGVHKLVELQKRIETYELTQKACFFPAKTTTEQLIKHAKELKNVYNYVGNKKQKNEFEEMLRQSFLANYKQAQEAIAIGQEIDVTKCRYQLCHKDYTYHNLLLVGNEMVIVNYDNMLLDCSVSDYAQYLRKIMEKHGWDVTLGEKLVMAYVNEGRLNLDERKDLYIRMLFPMRYWKIVNHYSNGRKNKVNSRDREKLMNYLELEERRQQFLVFLHSLIV